MNFIDWFDLVLNKLFEATHGNPPRRTTHESHLAATIYSEVFIARWEFWSESSTYLKGLKDALWELKKNGLIENPPAMGSDLYTVTPAGEEYMIDNMHLWQVINQIELDTESEQLLYVTNRMSQHAAQDHAWVEKVPHEQILTELNWQIEQLWEVSKSLEHHDLAYRNAGMGPTVILRAGYRGLVWERQRWGNSKQQ